MARTRLKTPPKITSHKIGWTARARTSVGSRVSFLNSTSATAAVSRRKSAMTEGLSAEAAGSAAGLADVTVVPCLLDGGSGKMNEDVFEGRLGRNGRLELGGTSDGSDF